MKPARWEASFVEALTHADYETDPLCADFSRCGGCKFQDITYEKQLAFKEHYVRELFRKAKIPYTVFGPILPSPLVWGYRNKMEFSFGDEVKDGELTLGMHEKGRHHNIVSLRECMISPDDFNTVRTACETYFRDLGETHFSTYKKSGFLRHLVLRHSFAKNEILINLVTTGEKNLDADTFAEMVLALPMQYNIAGILHTISNSQSDAVKPDSVRLLYGEDFLTESLCGLDFRISPFSFFQTNSKGAEVLYSKVREYAGDTADKTIFDLYCGTGTFETVMTGQSARFECDCRQQSRPSGFVAARKSIESALSGLDDLRSLPRIVGSRPDPGHVVLADDPRGEFDVVQLFSGADDCQSLVSGSLESASARNCQTSEEADG